jgi:CD2 antigen cytoplasmic tail-binding protein 2
LKAQRKGQTLAELENEEGGPVKESLVGMAQTKRAVKRKGDDLADTDLVKNVEQAEEDLEVEEDDGIQLEAFNLKEERRRGYFDEAGNYVENEKKDDDALDDAWLASDEGKVFLSIYRIIV